MLFQFSKQIVSKALLSARSEREEVVAQVVRESQTTASTYVFVEVGAVHLVHVIRVQACAALEHCCLVFFQTENSIIFLAKEKTQWACRFTFAQVDGLRPGRNEICKFENCTGSAPLRHQTVERHSVVYLELRKDLAVRAISGLRLVMFLFVYWIFRRAVSCRFLTHLADFLRFLGATSEPDCLFLDVDAATFVKALQNAANRVVVEC